MMKAVRRTKIVCTLGPAVDSDDAVRALLHAGMNVARLNFSHGTHDEHCERIRRVRRVSEQEQIPVALLLDTKGPEIRTGIVANEAGFDIVAGDSIVITTDDIIGSRERISISYKSLPVEMTPGNHIYVADGLIDLEVTKVQGNDVHCRVVSGGTLSSRKNVNIPGVRVSLPAITEKDLEDIRLAIREEIDFIAASFVRRPGNVVEIQKVLRDAGSDIRVIAKIEDQEGLSNIEEIVRVSDGIMVARGDLGVQLAVEEIPLVQKRIISLCNARNKPVITATQMLDSMIHNPRPTRAELTDVANAIFDGTDAVMLSGETATGRYPDRACETLSRIALAVEQSDEYVERSRKSFDFYDSSSDIGSAIAKATFVVATDVHAAAIITPTLRGNTPRILSRYRPVQNIIAVTTTSRVQRQLLLHWGVVPLVAGVVDESETMVQNAIGEALERGYIGPTDKVVTTAGVPLHSPIPMNTIKVHILGNVLNRGQDGVGEKATGRVVRCTDATDARGRLKLNGSEILVTPLLTEDFTGMVPRLRGAVLEDHSEIDHEQLLMMNESIVVISRVPDAGSLEDGITVTLDGREKIIYEGVM
jgi:pyruvate kinase